MRLASICAALFAALLAAGCSDAPDAAQQPSQPKSKPRHRATTIRLTMLQTGSLREPLQDAAAAPIGSGRFVLLGGLDARDASTNAVLAATTRRDSTRGTLPSVLHDAAAVSLGGAVYLFGGGNGTQQLSDILRVEPRSGTTTRVGSLPSPASDVSAATLGGTAYVVGGYTGSAWLDTIVAWRPGGAAHVVAHLPTPLRYSAVAADDDELVIAGGSTPAGTASRAVYAFDARTHAITRIATLPRPTTHAAAVTIRGQTYVIGGRGAATGTPTDRIVAVDPERRRAVAAGRLSTPLSDLAAVAIGRNRIGIAGGRGRAGPVAALGELVPASGRRVAVRRAVPNVYAHDAAGMVSAVAQRARPLIYVPNSMSNTVDEIDPRTLRVVREFAVGALPQHVTPSWDLKTLYVLNDLGNSLTAKQTGGDGRAIAAGAVHHHWPIAG